MATSTEIVPPSQQSMEQATFQNGVGQLLTAPMESAPGQRVMKIKRKVIKENLPIPDIFGPGPLSIIEFDNPQYQVTNSKQHKPVNISYKIEGARIGSLYARYEGFKIMFTTDEEAKKDTIFATATTPPACTIMQAGPKPCISWCFRPRHLLSVHDVQGEEVIHFIHEKSAGRFMEMQMFDKDDKQVHSVFTGSNNKCCYNDGCRGLKMEYGPPGAAGPRRKGDIQCDPELSSVFLPLAKGGELKFPPNATGAVKTGLLAMQMKILVEAVQKGCTTDTGVR